ncbi:hypothetical protein PRIPAC_87901, partial [Pristionchus pacificus]
MSSLSNLTICFAQFTAAFFPFHQLSIWSKENIRLISMALWIIVITVMICFYPFEDRDKFGIYSYDVISTGLSFLMLLFYSIIFARVFSMNHNHRINDTNTISKSLIRTISVYFMISFSEWPNNCFMIYVFIVKWQQNLPKIERYGQLVKPLLLTEEEMKIMRLVYRISIILCTSTVTWVLLIGFPRMRHLFTGHIAIAQIQRR